MITDIHSLVSGAGKSSTPSTSTPATIGTVAKLSTEIKLIEGLHPIQITSVKNAQSANGTSQLIGISRNNQQQYTLVNPKPDGNLRAGDKGTLNINGQTATLTVSRNQTNSIPSQGQTSTTTQAPSSTANTQSSIEQANTARSSNTSQTYAPSGNQNIAKTIAEVTIASRPITLTVISTNTATQNVAPTQNATSQVVQNAPLQTNSSAVTVKAPTPSSPQSEVITPKAPNSAPSAQSTVVTSQTNTQTSTPQKNPNSVQNQASVKTAVATTIAQTLASIPDTSTTNKAPANAPANAPAANTNPTFSAVVSDGQEQFTLTTKHPLKTGETLSVIVDKNGQLQFFPTTKASPTEVTLTEGLKQSLPKQITPQEFVGMIRQLNTLAQSGAQLPERLSNALNQLVQQLPNVQNLTQSADGLKQAIQNSGLFSENNLLTKTDNNADLKLNLSRLEGAANEASRQTNNLSATTAQQHALNMVSGAIERITTHQVRHLVENAQQQDGSILPLSIEVPIKDGRSTSVVNIRIDKDKDHKAEQEAHHRRWLVQLKFDFEETGRFEARASIQDKKVGILFAVEEADTEQLIRENLSDLRASLRAKQVEIEKLDCFRAKLNETQNKPIDHESKRLIDVRT